MSGRRHAVAWRLFQGSLFTLPWIGMGVMTLMTGRDLGAGLQPSWLLLALVVGLLWPDLVAFLRRQSRNWLPVVAPAAVALTLSVAGLWLAPVGEELSTVLLRFLKQVIQLDVMLAFVVVPVYFMARGRTLAELAGPLVLGTVFQGLYGLLQGVHYYHPLTAMGGLEAVFTSNPSILAGSEQLYLGNVLRDMPRLRGTACEPLYLGNYLLLTVPLVWLTDWRRRWQNMAGVGLIVVLLLTWSRGAWLAGAAAGVLFLLGAWRARIPISWRVLTRLAVAVPALVAVVLLVGIATGRSEVWLPWQRLHSSAGSADLRG